VPLLSPQLVVSGESIATIPAFFTRNNYTWADDVSWEHGKHDFHFAGSFERSAVDLNNLFNQPGILEFGTQDNHLFGGASFATYQLFLAGILSDGASVGNGLALQQGAGELKNNRANFVGVYVQDNVNGTDQISAFDKLNNNSAFGTFRAGQAADPCVAQLAAKVFF